MADKEEPSLGFFQLQHLNNGFRQRDIAEVTFT